ncbi:esterase/lipase family protein [Streptomyces gardneri]|uniref:Lipase n=1 Tax=Streptomyces gardneri TaxID=66892 RepID=A0A4Y3RHN9_9ACTN|nr:alpha/beta fold hydrolase [Streptomyces gardneri]GEB56428.1 lipase [Streptomyces gardneri]GHH11435.1 lipase [Streptomyces gardneri]
MELSKVTALMKATALELAILTGHLVLYPSGIVAERLSPSSPTTGRAAGPDADPSTDPAGGSTTGPSAGADATITPGVRPVVLLHGFVDNRSVFVLLRRVLNRHGRDCVESLNYSPLTCDLRSAAELLGRRVEEIRARTGHAEVDIVGHSLGGLIARYYVQRLGGDTRVRTLVMLGTPHSGTRVAPLADAHPLVRQMRPGSAVLRELADPAPGCRTRFVSFWSDLDQVMVPVETARLDHPDLLVHNIRVSGIGHLALPVHPTVAAGVLGALDAGGPVTRGTHEGETGAASVA